MPKLQQNHSLLRSSEINSGNNSSPSFCHGGPEMLQPELGRQPELLENQPERLGRQLELSWSTENPSVVWGTFAVLIALVGVKFQNSSENPFDSRPATITLTVIALLIYSFTAAWTRPIILDGKKQQILYSLVPISKVVCLACIVSLLIPYGPGWNVYVACASTLCFLVAVWAILWNFAPSCVVWLVPCMGPTRSSFRIAESNGCPVCGSSLVSENQSSSQQGGTSSNDAGSHSGHCKAEQSQLKHTCEHDVSSHQTDHSTQANGKTTNTSNTISPHIIQSSPHKGTKSEAHPDLDEKPIQSPNPLEVARDQGLDIPSLSQMPCVSTSASYKPAPFDHPLDV